MEIFETLLYLNSQNPGSLHSFQNIFSRIILFDIHDKSVGWSKTFVESKLRFREVKYLA